MEAQAQPEIIEMGWGPHGCLTSQAPFAYVCVFLLASFKVHSNTPASHKKMDDGMGNCEWKLSSEVPV